MCSFSRRLITKVSVQHQVAPLIHGVYLVDLFGKINARSHDVPMS